MIVFGAARFFCQSVARQRERQETVFFGLSRRGPLALTKGQESKLDRESDRHRFASLESRLPAPSFYRLENAEGETGRWRFLHSQVMRPPIYAHHATNPDRPGLVFDPRRQSVFRRLPAQQYRGRVKIRAGPVQLVF